MRPSRESLCDPACGFRAARRSNNIRRIYARGSAAQFAVLPASVHGRRVPRCPWATTEPAIAYHDKEWGVPVHDDTVLFEFLVLEGAQAGLSWITILKKRENYRRAVGGVDPAKVASYGPEQVEALLKDEGIIRNRLKIQATIENAKALLKIQEEFGSF